MAVRLHANRTRLEKEDHPPNPLEVYGPQPEGVVPGYKARAFRRPVPFGGKNGALEKRTKTRRR